MTGSRSTAVAGIARFALVASVCAGCAVTRVGEPDLRGSEAHPPVVRIQRYDVTGVLPGAGAIRLTGRDDKGTALSPPVRYWIAPTVNAGAALLWNGVLVGIPTIWHLVAGRADYLPDPDRWCLMTLVGSCRVLVEEPEAGPGNDVSAQGPRCSPQRRGSRAPSSTAPPGASDPLSSLQGTS